MQVGVDWAEGNCPDGKLLQGLCGAVQSGLWVTFALAHTGEEGLILHPQYKWSPFLSHIE